MKPFYRAGRRARRHKRRSKETVAVRRTGAAKIVARRPKSRIRFVVSRWFLSLRRMFKGFFERKKGNTIFCRKSVVTMSLL